MLQKTIRKPVTIRGVGLHSAKPVQVTIHPAGPSAGIVFVRTDLAGAKEIPAHFNYVVSTRLATTIGTDSQNTVSTIEHLMAAFFALGIDNARIEIDGPEMPILDGSSLPFVHALEGVGVESLLKAKSVLVLKDRIEFRMGEKWAVAEPCNRLEVHGSIEWDHPAIGFQEYRFIEGKTKATDFAGARTFCQLRDVEAMKRMGLAQGGSLENAIVVDDTKVINPEGLRYKNEFARHKVLDSLGDFMLAQVGLRASIRLHRAGHDLHQQLLAHIFKNPAAFEIRVGEKVARREELPAGLAAAMATAI
jgi:UDP-3-O-[3-hydroxymyristoyl] N-acetylglucosamine deacetylase